MFAHNNCHPFAAHIERSRQSFHLPASTGLTMSAPKFAGWKSSAMFPKTGFGVQPRDAGDPWRVIDDQRQQRNRCSHRTHD
jgi:hypothetical protein